MDDREQQELNAFLEELNRTGRATIGYEYEMIQNSPYEQEIKDRKKRELLGAAMAVLPLGKQYIVLINEKKIISDAAPWERRYRYQLKLFVKGAKVEAD